MQIPLTTAARLTLNPFDLLANNICLLCKNKHMITCYDGFEESYRVGDVCVPCYHRLMTEEAQFVEKIFLVRAIDGMLPEMATAIIVLL
jgi:hypothetical protein